MKKLGLVLTILLAVFFITFFLVTRNRDERQIRKNLISLAAMVSKSGNERELVALANARKIKSLFTKDCRIMIGTPVSETIGHNMLVPIILQVRRMVDKVDIDFYDISVIIGENQITAKTPMTAKATGPDPQGGGRVTEAREIEMRWKKVKNMWKIAEVQVIRTLR